MTMTCIVLLSAVALAGISTEVQAFHTQQQHSRPRRRHHRQITTALSAGAKPCDRDHRTKLHAFGKLASSAQKKKQQPLYSTFTSASAPPPSSVFDEFASSSSRSAWASPSRGRILKPSADRDEVGSLWSQATQTQKSELISDERFSTSSILTIVRMALMVTGNTVGAGMMVLPDVATEAGMGVCLPLMFGLYGVNLLSGLLISEVAIRQYESTSSQGETDKDDVPSSFKQLADSTLGEQAGTFISAVSIFVNSCVMSFDLVRAGEVYAGSGLPYSGSIDPSIVSVSVAAAIVATVTAASDNVLSKVSSAAVFMLFLSFAGLLGPGLLNMQDPMTTLMTPGTHAGSVIDHMMLAGPIFLMSLVYQNVVPIVTKMLDYDRCKTTTALALGSGIPMVMYIAWCFAALGGGVDSSLATGGPLLTLFSTVSLVGSEVAGTMSLSEEIGTLKNKFFPSSDIPEEEQQEVGTSAESGRNLSTVALGVLPPLIAGLVFSQGETFTSALSIAGGLGSPLLYGVLPAAMAFSQCRKDKMEKTEVECPFEVIPGGVMGMASLGALSAGFIGQQLVADFGGVLS